MQISYQTKRVTLQDIGGYLDMSSDTSYTRNQIDTKDANTSNAISTRINNLPIIDLQPYQLISNSYTKSQNEITSNYILNTSNAISFLLEDTIDLATTGRSILLSAINSSNYILNTSDAISFLLEDTIDLAMTGRSIALLSARNSSNYILNTSNVISTRINNTIIPFTNVITSSGSGTYFCVR